MELLPVYVTQAMAEQVDSNHVPPGPNCRNAGPSKESDSSMRKNEPEEGSVVSHGVGAESPKAQPPAD